ncbi:hypothetical protein QS257_13480 [Terrilactibacillus sp. S3-3]|nr:hypothetical protein QS257_13480 [Terrilactibacillus sp. S3-3]
MYRAGSEPHDAAASLQTAVKESGQMKQDAPIQSSAVQHQAQQQVELQAASGQFEAGQRTAAHVKISAMEKADTAQLIRPKDGNSDKSASPEIAGPAHQEEQTANKTGTLHPYYGRTVGKLQQWLIYQSQSASGERETPVHEQLPARWNSGCQTAVLV